MKVSVKTVAAVEAIQPMKRMFKTSYTMNVLHVKEPGNNKRPGGAERLL
jgi:hypothetical protein